jgi:RIO kinase 1
MKKGLISTVDYPVSTGKEANVFRATTPDDAFVAVKIYKMETAKFLRKSDYLEGDPRFERVKGSDRAIVEAFARKEFKNLQICQEATVNAPIPYFVRRNVLVMSFLGEDGLPYPRMSDVGIGDEKDLDSILADLQKMYKAGLVHADISKYNILLGEKPFIIDLGQGVVLRHPNAEEFLERDVRNIVKFFSSLGIKRDADELIKKIRGK